MKKDKLKKTKRLHKNTIEVLYQKLGNRWFIFSFINNELFFGKLPQQALPEIPRICDFSSLRKTIDLKTFIGSI